MQSKKVLGYQKKHSILLITEKQCDYFDIRKWYAKHGHKYPSLRIIGYGSHYHIEYNGEDRKIVLKKMLDLVKNQNITYTVVADFDLDQCRLRQMVQIDRIFWSWCRDFIP